MPCVMNLTTGKVHDAALAQTTIEKLLAANITVVMDRGYNDYLLFAWSRSEALHSSLASRTMP